MNHLTSRVTSSPTLLDRCQSWCTNHDHGSHPDDELCSRPTSAPAYGEVVLTHAATADGPMIALYRTIDELDLAGAEQLAHALLSSVAAARSGSRPTS